MKAAVITLTDLRMSFKTRGRRKACSQEASVLIKVRAASLNPLTGTYWRGPSRSLMIGCAPKERHGWALK